MMRQLWEKEVIRYLVLGGCTTGVNLSVYWVLRNAGGLSVNTANLLSIMAAILFAFFVNRYVVFRKGKEEARVITVEFIRFVEMRLGTLGVEFFGVILLNEWIKAADFVSKLTIQIVVMILNYVISKFAVFTDRKAGGVTDE